LPTVVAVAQISPPTSIHVVNGPEGDVPIFFTVAKYVSGLPLSKGSGV